MSSRMGRPREFKQRMRLTVFLDAHELKRVQKAAERRGLSASKFARQVLLEAVAHRTA